MWYEIINLCRTLVNTKLNITKFYSDFEIASHKSILKCLPTCKTVSSILHKIGLRKFSKILFYIIITLNNNSEIGDWLKRFFGLPLLPSDQIQHGFTELMSICPTDISYFSDDVLNNYIIEDAKFPPSMWAREPTDEPRTTNGAESFQSNYNSQFYHPHSNIYQVINILKEIQTKTLLKFNSISKQKINILRKKTIEKQDYTLKSWEE